MAKQELAYRMIYLLNKLNEQPNEQPNEQTNAPPSWIKEIEEILNSCNMRNIWLNPKSYKPSQLKKKLQRNL